MDACSIIGESTDAIVMVDSPVDKKEIREACKRWVVVFSFLFVETSKSLLCNLISSENEWMLKADMKVCVCFLPPWLLLVSLNGGLLNPAVSAVDSGNSTRQDSCCCCCCSCVSTLLQQHICCCLSFKNLY